MRNLRKNILLAVTVILCLYYVPTFGKFHSKDSLRFVSALFRHGDRTVASNVGESYPNDPYIHNDFYPEGVGQLTNIGKQRAYELGLNIRRKYNNFLNKVYILKENKARTTAIIRSKMTLQLVMAGIYPPAPIQTWNKKLKWQPIDLSYTPVEFDGLLLPVICPTYTDVYNEVASSQPVQEAMAQFYDLFDKLTEYTGKAIVNSSDCLLLYQTLSAQSHMGLTLPKWTEQFYPDGLLKDAAIFEYHLQSYDQTLRRRNGGIVLRNVIQEMASVINGSLPQRKLNLYSTQDVIVAGYLSALGIFDDEPPAYTSTVIIELHEKDQQFFVKVIHYLGIPEKFVDVTVPGCDALCPFDKFLKLMQPVMPLPEELTCVPPEPDETLL